MGFNKYYLDRHPLKAEFPVPAFLVPASQIPHDPIPQGAHNRELVDE